jgi:hypothetical protein
MLEEKQYNIIKFKIQRAHSIILLYKDDKYKPILNYIKRINFKVKNIRKLLPEQWNQFRLFIEYNYCSKCIHLYIVDDCLNKKQVWKNEEMDFCKSHFEYSIKF